MKDLRVLVTRPAEQAHDLCAKIDAAGGIAIPFPVLAIEALAANFNGVADIAIFTSANAVKYGLPLLSAQEKAGRIKFAAVGAKTAQVLAEAGSPPTIAPPAQFDSEGLLALPALQTEQVGGQNIAIFRGIGGREVLAQTLRQRGANVTYVEVYQRVRPRIDVANYPWIANGNVDAIIVTSGEGLMNLFTMLNDALWLRDKAFVVISPRVGELATARGISRVYCAKRADDEGLFEVLANSDIMR